MDLQQYLGNIDLNAVKKYSLTHSRHSQIHGISHWDRVAANGMKIAQMDEDVNKRVVILFAYLHDHKRRNDGYDSEHGPRAARTLYALEDNLLQDLTDDWLFEKYYENNQLVYTFPQYPQIKFTFTQVRRKCDF